MEAVGLKVRAVEEIVLRLKELLFPSIADVAVLSVDVITAEQPHNGFQMHPHGSNGDGTNSFTVWNRKR
jgi:hypothetical protein